MLLTKSDFQIWKGGGRERVNYDELSQAGWVSAIVVLSISASKDLKVDVHIDRKTGMDR